MTSALARVDVAAVPAAGARWSSGRWSLGLICVGALALVAGLVAVDHRVVGVFHDDAMYVILARALASGEGYRYLNLPGAPAATHFPPGYPVLLAFVSWFAPAFPASVVVFKSLNAALLAAAAVLVSRLARQRAFGERAALVLGAASGASIPLLVLGSLVLSEPLFLVLLLALLAALEAFVAQRREATSGDEPHRGRRAQRALLLGGAVAIATLVRSHGLVLVPAVVLVLAHRRRWREAGMFVGAAVVCLLPWQIWSAAHAGRLPEPLLGGYGSYAGWWLRGLREMGPNMIPATLARTVPESLAMFAVLFSPLRGGAARVATLVALVALSGVGAWQLRRRLPVTLLFLAGYVAIVLLWPFNPARFLWGIWPLLLLLVAAGVQAALRMPWRPAWTTRLARAALLAASVWVAVGYGAYEWRGISGEWWSSLARANERRIVPALQWTLANTAPGDVVAAEDEGAVYLYTGRLAVPVSSFTTAQYLRPVRAEEIAARGLLPILDAYAVRTVIVGTRPAADAAGVLVRTSTPRLAFRADFPGGVAYTVLPK